MNPLDPMIPMIPMIPMTPMSPLSPINALAPLPPISLPTASPLPQRYRIEHETHYAYAAAVSQSWQLARLTPRELPWQKLISCALQIDPPPDERHDTPDGFGNRITHFGLHGAHRSLRVRMQCWVEVSARPPLSPGADVAWESVRSALQSTAHTPERLHAAHMGQLTRLVPWSEAARGYAALSLRPGRGWLEAVTELMQRIHADFEFDPEATTVTTSVDEVLQKRRGVCQDFAHLMLACLRSHGLSARYVSGYLLTNPPPGQPRLMGVDASHAWVAAYAPQHGWVEFDPTNNQRADARYITLAWGADFADVVPLRGVILGGGKQEMRVSVSVIPA
jgi:transglutaminase-like putative cysteine protease